MSKRKKFSQFDLPTISPTDIYLVGYEVGTGQNGENKSVRVLASEITNTENEQFLDSLRYYRSENKFTTLNDTYETVPEGAANCISIQFSRQHFLSGRVKRIEIPYSNGSGVTGYLCAQIYPEGSAGNEQKTLDECYFSSNTQTQFSGVTDKCVFEFDNFVLPESYRFVRFMFVATNNVVPDGINGTNCISYRVSVLKNKSTDSMLETPDDSCKVWSQANTENNWFVHVTVIVANETQNHSIIEEVEQLKELVTTLQSELQTLQSNS